MNSVASLFLVFSALLTLFNCSNNVAGLGEEEPIKLNIEDTPSTVGELTQLYGYHSKFKIDGLGERAEIEDRLAQMTIDEKIGQLFWINVNSNDGRGEIDRAKRLIKDYDVGGIIWFRNTKKSTSPTRQVAYTNELQKAAKSPLIVSIDGEWGPNMRLDSTVKYPRQLALGAISDNRMIYDFGLEIGKQMKQLGIHFNFAPVVDVNNNPNNPVINDRSFGADKYNVANKGVAYMNGMHDAGILCTAKHFPGHGDTDTDSHYDLPVINHDRYRLYDIELYPFRELIQARLSGVMVAHLNVPALDNATNRPTTLSPKVVTDLLQNEMGFDGLIMTDAMNMQALTKYYPSGRAEVEALKAGNDILLYSKDVPTGINAIKAALNTGEITEDRINTSVRKILSAKRWLGILDDVPEIPTSGVTEFLNRREAVQLNKSLREKSITLVNNLDLQIPYKDLSSFSIATVSIDDGKIIPFQNALSPYAKMDHYTISSSASDSEYQNLLTKLSSYNQVIVGLVNQSRFASRSFGITQAQRTFLTQLEGQSKLVLNVFGNPYSLQYFENYRNLICAYDDHPATQKAAAEALFGVIGYQGSLPVGVNQIPIGSGFFTQGGHRLIYDSPEVFGISSDRFYRIDSIANAAIRSRATPGCVILIAKDNHVVYQKAFGYHTYNKQIRTKTSDLFDLASITKIAGSMPMIMKEYEQGTLNIYQPVSDLLPELRSTNKASMQVGEILNHTSGLKSWIPFYKTTVDKNSKPLPGVYRTTPATGYLQVAKNLYIKESYEKDSMFLKIHQADNNTRGRYVYSDLGFYFFKDYFETKYQKPYDEYLNEHFISRVGFPSLLYNPLDRFPSSAIIPSEKDDYFRNQEIRGYVHDMGAAMQGGVGGHAGLFGTANDIAIYMQLLLNKGSYGDVQYFQPSTIDTFTRKFNNNSRKALGFDKPELNPNRSGPTSSFASADSFGHTGFTGTFAWADPQNNLIVIFLSNRTYPTMNNRKLLTQNVRPKIQEEAYRIFEGM